MLQETLATLYSIPKIPIPDCSILLLLPIQARLLVAKPSDLNTCFRISLLSVAILIGSKGHPIYLQDNFVAGFIYNLVIFCSCMHSVHLTFTDRSLIDAPKIISFSQHGHSDLGWVGAFEMLTNMRGIGMTWGISHEKLPEAYENFLKCSLIEIIKQHAISIGAIAILTRFGDHNHGKTLVELIGCDVVITLATGALVWSCVSLAYHLLAFSVYIFKKVFGLQFDNQRWPPMFGNPLTADSVGSFWNERWQCALRRHFIICGYKPIFYTIKWLRIPGDVARYCGIINGFVISGILYEYCMRCTSGKQLMYGTYPSLSFFLISGLAIVLENAIEEYTGRKVGGIYGALWMSVILYFPALHMARQALLGFGPMQDLVEWETWRWLVPFSFIVKA